MQDASLFADATPGSPPSGVKGYERGLRVTSVALTCPLSDSLRPFSHGLPCSMKSGHDYLPDAKLVGKLNRGVRPEFVTVTEEPTRESWEGMKLGRYKLADDEGVPTKDVTLVEEDRLVGLPTGHRITFDDVSIRTLSDVYALGKEPALTNVGHSVGPGMYYRMAVVTPDILVEEMEFKARSGSEPRMVGMRSKSRPIACTMVLRAVLFCNLSAP